MGLRVNRKMFFFKRQKQITKLIRPPSLDKDSQDNYFNYYRTNNKLNIKQIKFCSKTSFGLKAKNLESKSLRNRAY